MVFGPAFSGLLTVCESYGNKANQPLQVIPTAPPPSIPSGLKHRFPLLTGVTQNETDGLDKHLIEEVEEGGKKKRKREKKIKLQQDEEMDILTVNENVAKVKTETPFQEGSVSEEKKKKKKKKKNDIEQDVVGESMVKCEPVDNWSNDVVEGSKKKKKSKIDGD